MADENNRSLPPGSSSFAGIPVSAQVDPLKKELKQALKRLRPDQRELLRLYVVENLSCAQIADRKRQSRSSIRRTLSIIYAHLLTQTGVA